MNINVIGTSASGKSTFSRKLAKVIDVPHIEMDEIFWGPDWYWPSDDEFFKKLKLSLAVESWILDGNYLRTTDIKWRNVDIVIWIDYSFARIVFQSISRAISRALSKQELWPNTGNIETFRKLFSKDSIILWAIKCYYPNRRKYKKMMLSQQYSHIEFVRLRSPVESKEYLANIKKSGSA